MAVGRDFYSILEALVRHRVDFIVVGGVAAVLEGAPISTFDLDIVYDRSDENVEPLGEALRELGAIYRDPAGRRIEPDVPRLATMKRHLLHTKYRPLDVLCVIAPGWTYDDLLDRAHEREIGDLSVHVLDLQAVIESKEAANRDKDKAVLPVLRQTLKLRQAN